ncbi:MAG: HNH endonuclease [Pirellulales bacterium]|nr:HNH endonuclease [Pirellulales bacterium]
MAFISPELRHSVINRAGGSCEYCGLAQETQVATFPVDHIIPICAGGLTQSDNLALACPRCNASKWIHDSALDPESGEQVPLFHPRRDDWLEHFSWSSVDETILLARSPSARATLALLDLNSIQRRQVRLWLQTIGLHLLRGRAPHTDGPQ